MQLLDTGIKTQHNVNSYPINRSNKKILFNFLLPKKKTNLTINEIPVLITCRSPENN